MPFLLSFITGTGGQLILKLLPYILALGAIGGAYLYGHHRGTVACHDKELQAVIDVQNQKLVEMQKQYEDSQRVIGNLTANNNKIQDITRTISSKIAALPNPKGCEINKDVISLINQARTGDTGQPKK